MKLWHTHIRWLTIEPLFKQLTEAFEGRVASLILFTLISTVATIIGWRYGFFRPLPPAFPSSFVRLRHVVISFLLAFLVMALIAPFVGTIILAAIYGSSMQTVIASPLTQGWLNAGAVIGSVVAVTVYSLSLGVHTRHEVWGRHENKSKIAKNYLFGAMTWLIVFPIANTVAQAASIILLLIKPDAQVNVDQVAVQLLKSVMSYPIMLTFIILCLVFIAPIVEEILFRGFLQSWLKPRLGTWKAIIVSSCIFTAFHFSASQEFANIELLSSLLALSLFLGYLFERQRSLFASIGLHATFNAISVLFIVLDAYTDF